MQWSAWCAHSGLPLSALADPPPGKCEKLERVRGTGKPFEIAEEFRRLTLQVIGEAILSLAPEESDRVFPHLYLPIMEEGNRRSLEPWRTYLPIPWFRHRSNVRQLNSYIIGALRLPAAHTGLTWRARWT